MISAIGLVEPGLAVGRGRQPDGGHLATPLSGGAGFCACKVTPGGDGGEISGRGSGGDYRHVLPPSRS